MDAIRKLNNRNLPVEKPKVPEDLKSKGKKYIPVALNTSSKLKSQLISRLFWGRSNLYKNITHFLMVFIATVFLVSGLVNKITSSNDVQRSLSEDQLLSGTTDSLYQGGSLETIAKSELGITGLPISSHTVENGENLQTISQKFNVTADTIRWANKEKLDFGSFLTDNVPVGTVLSIPAINGVLYTVTPGQTIDDVIRVTSLNNDEANRFNIEQFNNLEEPYTLTAGQKLFIPNGNLASTDVDEVYNIPQGIFINPLSDVNCSGYSFSRGFLFYHNGLDLARWPGCPIEAVANGTVIYAGWSLGGEGYNVRIDHGGGIVSHYYHGNGEFYVKVGDRVSQGQPIMYMGTTGNSTGVHLHFSLFYRGRAIDPAPYVPF